ncbi:MAG TPA: enolase C-terminal domain-like protein [Candidatus Nanoarchaeia archaeon]|nr:enolase C-terminal domain-like protein [Candidatus Nanoarchaeia archaeon]
MVKIKKVGATSLLDSRKEKTVLITISTDIGNFSASSPTGKSTGKYEAKPYKKSLEGDIKTIKEFGEYFSKEILEKFRDLRRIEDITDRNIGANTLFALESAILKAIAKEQKKQVWQVINPNAKNLPRLVGNCIGGGKHSKGDKRPDFQEFELIPDTKTVKEAYELNKKMKKEVERLLKDADKKFRSQENDENAWVTSLNEKDALEVLSKTSLPLGVDVAASSFYKRKKYNYQNPLFKRTEEEQLMYVSNLIKNYNLFYVEDPFEEDDFEGFAKLLKKCPNSLIVGDDLTTTNPKKLEKAIKMKSINAIIVKPNQIGSLLKVKDVVEMAKKNDIKVIFSHRSGETEETILADLAFGFQSDFFKCGIEGDVREKKIKRLIEIEKSLK